MSLEDRLEISASKMGLRVPFIMAATGRLPRSVVDDNGDFTAATNGSWFKFGRKWIEDSGITEEELFGLDLHERMHVVLMHMWRRDGRDMSTWNQANDAIINATIISMGYVLPKGGVHIDWVTPDMDSEQVYNKLMQEQQKQKPMNGNGKGQGQGQPQGKGNGQGGSGQQMKKGGWDNKGDIEDAPDNASASDTEATIRAAAQMARDCGDTSVLVNRILGNPPKATVNWKDEVRAALTSSARDDFTYRRFSRRFLSRKLYMPALQSDAMGGLLIGFDTSGSVSEADARQIAGEIQGIADDLQPEWIEVAYCDTRVTSTQRFNRGDTLELRPTGGGGTRFKPVFDYANKLQEGGEKVAAMIYLTDMEGPMSELVEPEFPVVWGVCYATLQEAPFGAVVRVIV